MARGGLLFAFASEASPIGPSPRSWLRPWHQSSAAYRRELFNDEDTATGADKCWESAQRYLITLVNPHRHGGGEEQGANITNYLDTWLWRRASALAHLSGGDELDDMVKKSTEIARQLFLNIREYAGLDRQRRGDHRDTSLMQVFFTRGGGARSGNRLYVLVMDTGVGIPTRVREMQEDVDMPADKALQGALDGSFRQLRANRGWGLSDIREACAQASALRIPGTAPGRMLIAAGDLDRANQSTVASMVFDDSRGYETFQTSNVPFQGTCVLVELPLRIGSERNTAIEQLELDFEYGDDAY
jgi:hypothetical protein